MSDKAQNSLFKKLFAPMADFVHCSNEIERRTTESIKTPPVLLDRFFRTKLDKLSDLNLGFAAALDPLAEKPCPEAALLSETQEFLTFHAWNMRTDMQRAFGVPVPCVTRNANGVFMGYRRILDTGEVKGLIQNDGYAYDKTREVTAMLERGIAAGQILNPGLFKARVMNIQLHMDVFNARAWTKAREGEGVFLWFQSNKARAAKACATLKDTLTPFVTGAQSGEAAFDEMSQKIVPELLFTHMGWGNVGSHPPQAAYHMFVDAYSFQPGDSATDCSRNSIECLTWRVGTMVRALGRTLRKQEGPALTGAARGAMNDALRDFAGSARKMTNFIQDSYNRKSTDPLWHADYMDRELAMIKAQHAVYAAKGLKAPWVQPAKEQLVA